MLLTDTDILNAQQRISPYVTRTPLLTSSLLDRWLNHKIIFKAECFQKIGAFKVRGALNTLLRLKEQNKLPKKVVAYSSGNHAQAVAYASKMLDVEATIIMPAFASTIKQQATISYGATLETTPTRQEAEARAHALTAEGYYLLPPYDHDDVISGQATACLEALEDSTNVSAIFTPVGGGGLISGTFLAAKIHNIAVYGGEPSIANDAAKSYRNGKICTLPNTPPTIADGVQTLSVSSRTFDYIQQLNGIIEVSERDIIYWVQWLNHLLKISVEPASAVAMAAAAHWIKEKTEPQTILIILSGGNISPETQRKIWKDNYLETTPEQWINL